MPRFNTRQSACERASQYANWLVTSPSPSGGASSGDRNPGVPAVVVVIAGVNDIYQGRSAASVEQQLEQMYDAARAHGIAVVAGTIVPYNTATADQNARMRAVNDWIRAYAERQASVVFCDTRAAVAAPGAPDRLASSPDDLHPSPDGYRLMAHALEPAIERALTQATRLG